MTEQEIQKDRQDRIAACKDAVQKILADYQFALVAEDNWTPNTKVRIEIMFADLKKYDAPIAQQDQPIVSPFVPTVNAPASTDNAAPALPDGGPVAPQTA